MDNELRVSLESEIGAFLEMKGFDLVEIILKGESTGLVLRVLADRPEGGITVGECSRLNREIGFMLEEKNTFGSAYLLEVSSPGLDRPLRSVKDFTRVTGERVRFHLNTPINGKVEHTGTIMRISEESVEAETKDGSIIIPLAAIHKAVRIFD